MPRTVELPDDLADILTDEAARAGMSLPDYAVRVLAANRLPTAGVNTGAVLVDFWRAEGLIGSRPEIVDGPARARDLRVQAENRGV
jgi:hypothetical protein